MSTELTTSADNALNTKPCADGDATPDTTSEARPGTPADAMVDSRMLRLYRACRAFQDRLIEQLAARLETLGYTRVTASHLTFLAELECGENHAAELARRTGISRQAVHKQVKELAALGLLAERADPHRRNQRTIVFTDRGTQLIADCRAILAEMDADLPRDDGMTPDNAVSFLGLAAGRFGAGSD